MISSTQANNTPEALRRYREGHDRAFKRVVCWRCEDTGKIRDYTPEQIEAMQCATTDGQCVFKMHEMTCPVCKRGEQG